MGKVQVPGEVADEGFAVLYQEQLQRLTRVAYLLCGDVRVAEDAVSSVIARVLPRWRAGKLQEPGAYLRRAVVNEVIGSFRRRSSERRANERLRRGPDAAPDVAIEVVARDAIWVALGELPVDQRAVLVLRYFEDLTEAETAEVLKIAVGTVKSRAARAFERLRSALAEERSDA